MIQYVELSRLAPDPDNVRHTFRAIRELANSIKEHGLLQNLVVLEEGDTIIVKAGNRRLKAMQLLVEEGHLAEDMMIPCLFSDSINDAMWEALTENIQRDDIPIWDLGIRLVSLNEAGLSQQEIAARVGKSQGYVSRVIRMGKSIHPIIVQRLRKQPALITFKQLDQLATLVDKDTGEPLEKAQLRTFAMYIEQGSKPKKSGTKHIPEGKLVYNRFKRMRDLLYIPPHADRYARVIIAYLQGDTKTLDFEVAVPARRKQQGQQLGRYDPYGE